MALFGSKKKEKQAGTPAQQTGGSAVMAQPDIEDVIIGPRVTEKAALGSEHNVYVFNVEPEATKSDIKRAIRRMYKVTPRKVNVAKIPYKQVRRRGITGWKRGGKKAYVYLKEGDKIELM